MNNKKAVVVCSAAVFSSVSLLLGGCGKESDNGKIQIEMVQYKPEAVKAFEEMEKRFNESHDDIELKIESPNDAMTVLKTRFIKEDVPDIIGIGGDINYSNFVDSDMLADISDFEGLSTIKQAYLDIDKNLEFVPMEGTYAVPYVANAAGILYNRTMFQENGWEIPTTWDEFIELLETSQASGQLPLYFGFKDTWTCLAPWNAMACDLAPADVCQQVNKGETTFAEEYRELSEKILQLLPYAQADPFAYSYNDACTAFARGESAMYCIGSYAVPQILSVNPDLDIDSFVFPANDNADEQLLNSGIDLQFCVMKDCKNKEAAYEVLNFLLEDESIQIYLDEQNAVPCKDSDFTLPSMLDGMKTYIDEGKMVDYQDHYYPSEMSVDALIQTYLMEGDTDAFLENFDKQWIRYNRDLIRKVQNYEAEHSSDERSER
ncbi:MAG: extracellular solute-binding protein [Lachnospiraceae bacterium]|nr:extracellular solute-binding protein [Robinsoniella sp.]MDY3766416.1 extracellular solute-binding protein [Lachnospiraceae bacterium]